MVRPAGAGRRREPDLRRFAEQNTEEQFGYVFDRRFEIVGAIRSSLGSVARLPSQDAALSKREGELRCPSGASGWLNQAVRGCDLDRGEDLLGHLVRQLLRAGPAGTAASCGPLPGRLGSQAVRRGTLGRGAVQARASSRLTEVRPPKSSQPSRMWSCVDRALEAA